jgi:hypothetical protein
MIYGTFFNKNIFINVIFCKLIQYPFLYIINYYKIKYIKIYRDTYKI